MSSGTVNKVTLLGNLGADPTIRESKTGMKIASISLATSYKDKTSWHRVVFFDKIANVVEKYLKKGSKIYMEGRIEYQKYTNKQGQEVWATQIVGHEMQMQSSKNQVQSNEQDNPTLQGIPVAEGNKDEDIPF
jgi:single-strand DNA-binding protein